MTKRMMKAIFRPDIRAKNGTSITPISESAWLAVLNAEARLCHDQSCVPRIEAGRNEGSVSVCAPTKYLK